MKSNCFNEKISLGCGGGLQCAAGQRGMLAIKESGNFALSSAFLVDGILQNHWAMLGDCVLFLIKEALRLMVKSLQFFGALLKIISGRGHSAQWSLG